MKLHDLRPPEGANTRRTRVGRGIAAGKGKTAGRGTKGQKARAGGSIPPWFEGGQTPLHMRIPKLRGFKNRFKVEYEVVNVGAIAALVELGALEAPDGGGKGKAKASGPITVNQDILRATGLVRTLNKPLKILGTGELSTPLFVVADAFSKSAVAKIEAAGGSVNVLEIPSRPTRAIGVEPVAATEAVAGPEPDADASEPTATRPEAVAEGQPAAKPKRGKAKAAEPVSAVESAPEPTEPAPVEPAEPAGSATDDDTADESAATAEDGSEAAPDDIPAGDDLPTEAADSTESDAGGDESASSDDPV
jgi:large subunit ribosomal protein L15